MSTSILYDHSVESNDPSLHQFLLKNYGHDSTFVQPSKIPQGYWDMETPRAARPSSADFSSTPPSPATFRDSYIFDLQHRGPSSPASPISPISPVSTSSVSSLWSRPLSRPTSSDSSSSSYSKGAAQNWRSSWDSYHGLNRPTSLATPPRLAIGVERKLKNKPGDAFAKLPEEILISIMTELRDIHRAPDSDSCDTCWMRDACSLALTNRKWRAASRKVLYSQIHIIGSDSSNHIKKKFKWPIGCRLKLLRRTLRSYPSLAERVRELKVPDVPESLPQTDREKYLDLVASVIMACPKLERLAGFYHPYDHEYSRLVQALATRQHLTERTWILDPNPYQKQGRISMMDIPTYVPFSPDTLQLDQQATFRSFHTNWKSLHTLVIHCNQGAKLDHYLLASVFQVLPSLAHLHISNVPTDAFTDATLCGLPPLKSLRLEDINGVTDSGISRFVSRPESQSLESLTLIHTPLTSLAVLARLFSNLVSLRKFTLLQDSPPVRSDDMAIFLQPYLASQSLEFLHWEFLGGGNDANELFALSIAHNGFPSLRTIRSPSDDGSLQAQCRPSVVMQLPTDKLATPSSSKSNKSVGSQSSIRGLKAARQAAQARMDVARFKAKFHIVVWDEGEEPIERFEVGRYLGVVGSPITFSLHPDIPGSDNALVKIEDMLHTDSGADCSTSCCTGSWNSSHSKKIWQHQERLRWREIKPSSFF